MDYLFEFIVAFETQNLAQIRPCFEIGINPNQLHNCKPLVYELINMYKRRPLFRQWIQVFVDFGLNFDYKILLAVLLNDASKLEKLSAENPLAIHQKYTFDCAFTPLFEASLFHICAEYNHLEAAKILVKNGANINVKTGFDENGFGGQTPIYHTVNQHNNLCLDMLNYLISEKAGLSQTVKGFIWGQCYDWETFVPAINPINYAMMGLLKQFQRTEQ